MPRGLWGAPCSHQQLGRRASAAGREDEEEPAETDAQMTVDWEGIETLASVGAAENTSGAGQTCGASHAVSLPGGISLAPRDPQQSFKRGF